MKWQPRVGYMCVAQQRYLCIFRLTAPRNICSREEAEEEEEGEEAVAVTAAVTGTGTMDSLRSRLDCACPLPSRLDCHCRGRERSQPPATRALRSSSSTHTAWREDGDKGERELCLSCRRGPPRRKLDPSFSSAGARGRVSARVTERRVLASKGPEVRCRLATR